MESTRLELVPASDRDLERLHALMRLREVYRYLADDQEPPREAVQAWLSQSHADFDTCGVGLWLLVADGADVLAGCVRLEARPEARAAEITWVLHPERRGRGLATRMSWTVIRHAFAAGRIDRIIAGADLPNEDSVAVMKRLGMRFLRDVEYPLYPGCEYVLEAGDPAPERLPEAIPLRAPA